MGLGILFFSLRGTFKCCCLWYTNLISELLKLCNSNHLLLKLLLQLKVQIKKSTIHLFGKAYDHIPSPIWNPSNIFSCRFNFWTWGLYLFVSHISLQRTGEPRENMKVCDEGLGKERLRLNSKFTPPSSPPLPSLTSLELDSLGQSPSVRLHLFPPG